MSQETKQITPETTMELRKLFTDLSDAADAVNTASETFSMAEGTLSQFMRTVLQTLGIPTEEAHLWTFNQDGTAMVRVQNPEPVTEAAQCAPAQEDCDPGDCHK